MWGDEYDSASANNADASDSQQIWDVKCILAEKGKKYKVDWEGVDPATGKPWPNSWVLKTDCTPALIAEWKEAKKKRKSTNNRQRSESSRTSASVFHPTPIQQKVLKNIKLKLSPTASLRTPVHNKEVDRSPIRRRSPSPASPIEPATKKRRKEINGESVAEPIASPSKRAAAIGQLTASKKKKREKETEQSARRPDNAEGSSPGKADRKGKAKEIAVDDESDDEPVPSVLSGYAFGPKSAQKAIWQRQSIGSLASPSAAGARDTPVALTTRPKPPRTTKPPLVSKKPSTTASAGQKRKHIQIENEEEEEEEEEEDSIILIPSPPANPTKKTLPQKAKVVPSKYPVKKTPLRHSVSDEHHTGKSKNGTPKPSETGLQRAASSVQPASDLDDEVEEVEEAVPRVPVNGKKRRVPVAAKPAGKSASEGVGSDTSRPSSNTKALKHAKGASTGRGQESEEESDLSLVVLPGARTDTSRKPLRIESAATTQKSTQSLSYISKTSARATPQYVVQENGIVLAVESDWDEQEPPMNEANDDAGQQSIELSRNNDDDDWQMEPQSNFNEFDERDPLAANPSQTFSEDDPLAREPSRPSSASPSRHVSPPPPPMVGQRTKESQETSQKTNTSKGSIVPDSESLGHSQDGSAGVRSQSSPAYPGGLKALLSKGKAGLVRSGSMFMDRRDQVAVESNGVPTASASWKAKHRESIASASSKPLQPVPNLTPSMFKPYLPSAADQTQDEDPIESPSRPPRAITSTIESISQESDRTDFSGQHIRERPWASAGLKPVVPEPKTRIPMSAMLKSKDMEEEIRKSQRYRESREALRDGELDELLAESNQVAGDLVTEKSLDVAPPVCDEQPLPPPKPTTSDKATSPIPPEPLQLPLEVRALLESQAAEIVALKSVIEAKDNETTALLSANTFLEASKAAIDSDLDFMRDQYREASMRGAGLADENTALEKANRKLMTENARLLAQTRTAVVEVRSFFETQMKQVQAEARKSEFQAKMLLEQARRTGIRLAGDDDMEVDVDAGEVRRRAGDWLHVSRQRDKLELDFAELREDSTRREEILTMLRDEEEERRKTAVKRRKELDVQCKELQEKVQVLEEQVEGLQALHSNPIATEMEVDKEPGMDADDDNVAVCHWISAGRLCHQPFDTREICKLHVENEHASKEALPETAHTPPSSAPYPTVLATSGPVRM